MLVLAGHRYSKLHILGLTISEIQCKQVCIIKRWNELNCKINGTKTANSQQTEVYHIRKVDVIVNVVGFHTI